MSRLTALDQLLEQYQQLQYHQDPALRLRLGQAQQWLKNRIQDTHQTLFNQPENQLMAQYFLQRLYGGSEFDALALQIERLLKYAHKAEKMIPENAIRTGLKSVGLAVLAMQLDEQVTIQLLRDYPLDQPIDDEMMRLTLIRLDQQQARLQQLELLDELGSSLDKYMNSFMMHTAFRMCKGVAMKYHFELMYDFIGEGFVAMKPMKSAADFIQQFTEKERLIVDNVHSDKPKPFKI
ncbi:FFLEELY motif protein [Acinetobacter sp. WZC-1]|uniref:FFLEELY motif protein n=1 Tax=Acinetobacter sp. WZC-1 TaxID=3459034 RepID=UPI00403D71B0